MQELFENILNKFKQDHDNGLYFINTPTGSAKTYSAVQLMKNHIEDKEFKKHFVFITNNLNNLPVQELKNALSEDEYNKYVIRVESLRDNIIHNFPKILEDNNVPEDIKNHDSFKELQNALNSYNSWTDIIKNPSNATSDALEIYENKKNNLDKAERDFRIFLRNYFSTKLQQNNVPQERYKETILSDYTWLETLYPTIFLDDYKIILMSVKKFFTTIDPIFKSAYRFSNSEILKDSVLFIDEVDATKAEIGKIIIDGSVHSKANLILMANHIINQLYSFEESMPFDAKRIVKESNGIENLFKKVKDNAEFIRENYHDDLHFLCDSIIGRNFLMSDSSFHSCFENKNKKNAYVFKNETSNYMRIEIANSKKEICDSLSESFPDLEESAIDNLFKVIRAINRFLLSMKSLFTEMAKVFRENKNAAGEELISEEDALYSIFRVFNLPKEYIEFFKNEISLEPSIKIGKATQDKFKKSNSYYDRGIRTFEITNRKDDSFNSLINYIYIAHTPEKILVNLAKNSLIIGLSATCRINSVLSNYSLNYLKENLKDRFHTLNDLEEDFKRIKANYNENNSKYGVDDDKEKVTVVVNQIDEGMENCKNQEVLLNHLFEDDRAKHAARQLFQNKINSNNSNNNIYLMKRCIIIAKAYKYFIQNDNIQSFLCLNNALPKEEGDFNIQVLKKLFKLVLIDTQKYESNDNDEIDKFVDNSIVLLKSGASFESDKENLLTRLSNGEKIFVMSAYATLGAGQNLAYKVPKNLKLINLTDNKNKNDARNSKKDFDGIFLGEITHAVMNLNDTTTPFTETELFQTLIQLENLYENDEISHYVLKEGIETAFEKLKHPKQKKNIDIRNCDSVRLFKSKQIIQAVGRLSRSFNKSEEIHLLITSDAVNNFDVSLMDEEILSPETHKLAEIIKNKQNKTKRNSTVENCASRKSSQGKGHIFELLAGEWEKEKIDAYKKLGETVLKYPTCSKEDATKNIILSEYYIESGKEFNKYFFTESGDFENTDIFFNSSKEEVSTRISNDKSIPSWKKNNIKEASMENARLETILKYPNLKKHFEDKGFATTFAENEMMMSPVLYQNIYKGRLGEVAGKFIIENTLGITLEDLEDDNFELFDFKCENIYIDFKHWRFSSFKKNKMLKQIRAKLDKVKGEKALIINILDDNTEHTISESEDVIEIPALLNNDGSVNKVAIDKINEILGGKNGQ